MVWRNRGGGGSWSTKIIGFSNDLNESKRPTSESGQKALVQVQNRYSLWLLPSNPVDVSHGLREVWVTVHGGDAGRLGNRILRDAGVE